MLVWPFGKKLQALCSSKNGTIYMNTFELHACPLIDFFVKFIFN